jgi:hypothetical protein
MQNLPKNRLSEGFVGWETLVTEQLHGETGQNYSTADLFLRKQYKLALEGNTRAIRVMMSMLKENNAERKKRCFYYSEWDDPIAERRRRAIIRDRCRADPALLLLGIAVVDNRRVSMVGLPEDQGFEKRLRSMRPTHLADWVVDFARMRAVRHNLRISVCSGSTVRAEDDVDIRLWQANKGMLLERIVAAHGPSGSRFAKGQSPNPRGRPRKKPNSSCEEFPFDGFFMEPVTIPFGSKSYVVTRLDALMWSLSIKAAKGEAKIAEVIAPTIIQLKLLKWKQSNLPKIVETRI